MRWTVLAMVVVGCSGSGAGKSTPPTSGSGAPVSMVTSAVVVSACPDSARIDSKQASREIEELVSPCATVPGGNAHFSATLMPGGRVELGSPSGDPAGGVVPTCLLQNQKQLKHRIRLRAACRFDVKLEERRTE